MFSVQCLSRVCCDSRKYGYIAAALVLSTLACDAQWRTWTSTEGEFSVSLPSTPIESSLTSDQWLGPGARTELGIESLDVLSAPVAGKQDNAFLTLWYSWTLSHRGGYFIAFARMPPEISQLQIARFLDELVTFRTRETASANREGLSEQSMACSRELSESRRLSEQAHDVREVLFEEKCPNQKSYAYRERYLVGNGRLYVLTVVGERESSNADVTVEPRTPDADEFFRSFRLEGG